MSRPTSRAYLSLLVLLAIPGCPEVGCPTGLVLGPDGRCAFAEDAAVDPRAGDAGRSLAPIADASTAPDASAPDAGPDVLGADAGCVTTLYFRDADGDTHGDPTDSISACAPPTGFVLGSDDCDDACAACHPGATEVCDGTLDESCTGGVDEGCECTDGATRTCGTDVGSCELGTEACVAGRWGTCAGGIAPIVESAALCNGSDDDCDGSTDEGIMSTWYRDQDADRRGLGSPLLACAMPTGYAASNDDCDDASSARAPGLTEVCDGVDNDCDLSADDGYPCALGAHVACVTSCGSTGSGACTPSCALPTGASCTPPGETCDEVDQDCDGVIDEGVHRVGPRREPGIGRGRVMAFAVSPGFLVVYNTVDGLRARQYDEAGSSHIGTEILIATTHGVVPFSASVSGSYIVFAWLDSANLRARAFRVADMSPVTGEVTILAGVGSFANRVGVVAGVGGVSLAYYSGSGIYLVARTFPTLAGTDRAYALDTTTDPDFDLAVSGNRAYIAYADLDHDIEIRSFFVGGLVDTSVVTTVTSGGDLDRAPSLHVASVGGTPRLGVAWDQHGSTALSQRIRFRTYDIASTGGLTAHDAVDAMGSATSPATTPDTAMAGSSLDVTWAGGRWVISVLRSALGTTSSWWVAEIAEPTGLTPRVTTTTIESAAMENVSTAIVAGAGSRVFVASQRATEWTRTYVYGCGY